MTINGVRETICENCEYRCVCCYKEKYLSIVKGIDLTLQNLNTDFIKPVEPVCIHYKKTVVDYKAKPNYRSRGEGVWQPGDED